MWLVPLVIIPDICLSVSRELLNSFSTTNIKFFFDKRRINFHPARQIFNGVAVATARKSNAAEGNLGKFSIKILNVRCANAA